MASLVSENRPLILETLARYRKCGIAVLCEDPYSYAFLKESDTTSTFKFKKDEFWSKPDFDPANVSDPLYYADSENGDNINPINAEVF